METVGPNDNQLVLVLSEDEARALGEILRYAGVRGIHNQMNRALSEAVDAFAPPAYPFSVQRIGAFA